jgi:hypothetical protein
MPEEKQGNMRKLQMTKTVLGILSYLVAIAQNLFDWNLMGFMKNYITHLMIPLIIGTLFLVWGYWDRVKEIHSRISPKVRFVVYPVLIIAFLVWWGWPRIEDATKERGTLYEVKWMTEEETENFIIETLRESGRDVFRQRARMLIAYTLYHTNSFASGTRFRCESDTTWQIITRELLVSVFHYRDYDGTYRLSAGTNCEIEYLKERVLRTGWLDREKNMRPRAANPNLD